MLLNLAQAAIPPPDGCGFDEAKWELIVKAKKINALSNKEKFTCGTKQRYEAILNTLKIVKGTKAANIEGDWKVYFTDYDYTKTGCTGPTSFEFRAGKEYRIFMHPILGNPQIPHYCNIYMSEELK